MRPQGIRALRFATLAAAVGVAVVVGVSLRRPRDVSTPESTAAPAPKNVSRIEGVVFRSFRKGDESMLLEAERWIGQEGEEVQLEQVKMQFEFTARGERQPATVTANAGTYSPVKQRAVFDGDAHVVTADGFSLRTDRLVYRADTQAAHSRGHVTFERKDLSGEAVGMAYDALGGSIDLEQDVVLRVSDPDEPEMVIRSSRARINRLERVLYFEGGTLVTREGDRIESDWLRLYIGEGDSIDRARFGGQVTWNGHGNVGLPGGAGAPVSSDWWRIESRRLDLRFGEDRGLDEAVASPDGVLTLGPVPGESGERRLVSDTLSFHFDEQRRMEALVGLGGPPGITFEADAVGDKPARKLTARRFEARFDPVTGDVSRVDFFVDVDYVEGARRGRAGEATWDAVQRELVMREQPQVEDAEERSKLFAELIRIDSGTGDVHARDAVRHVVRGRVGPLGADEGPPTVVNCQLFDFSAADQTARYEGDAVLRSGADEVRAATIVLEEETGGTQQLTATGDVVARLGAGGAASAEEGEAGVVTARAARMVYSGAAGEVRYTGGVIISQGQLETRSPTATMQLEGEPLTFKELVAGEPVEVRHGERVARGQRGRYTPADETMVIEGEDASLTDPTQSVQGRRLTFRLGEDDVIVEGRNVRTEMVITPH